jgi:hypothetical protein
MISERALPTDAIAERSTRLATTSTSALVMMSPASAPSPRPRSEERRELPGLASVLVSPPEA